MTDSIFKRMGGVIGNAIKENQANQADLQAQINNKVDVNRVLTDVPAGAVFTDTTYSNATTLVSGLMSNTDKSKLDGIESGATGDQTAVEILTLLKTVDGTGSGLDADLLDGQTGSYYTDYTDSKVAALGTPTSGNLSNCTVDGSVSVGYRNVPWSGSDDKTTTYTLTRADIGKFVSLGTNGAITIPTGVFSSGDVISLFNNASSAATITCSALTTYSVGNNTVRVSVSLATKGMCTVFFYNSSTCIVSGTIT